MKVDYKVLFTNRIVYVTGVGRSGTTIIGQILSSMRPAYYLFEPAILRSPLSKDIETLRRNVFEDYFLPQVHGRCNPNPHDWTYWGNQSCMSEIENRWEHVRRRDDALELIDNERPLWIVKNPESQPLAHELGKVFPGVRFINVIRNGLDVVRSCIERGWFADNYQPIDLSSESGRPWYIYQGEAPEATWKKWNPETRAACNWRVLSQIDVPGMVVRYEEFVQSPFQCVERWTVEPGLIPTDLTYLHAKRVKEWKPVTRSKVALTDIQEPERTRFCETMEMLGYEI